MHKATPLEGPRQRPRRVPKGRRRPASVASGQTASVQVIRFDFKPGSVERSLFTFGHCEAFKHGTHLLIINIINTIIVL
jgi:hypothetical protein